MKFRSAVVLMMILAGCASSTSNGKLTDPQIAMIMRVLNLGEVREGELVRDKTTNATVKEFAQTMINEHDAQNNKAEAELLRVDINSEDTPTSRQLDAASGAITDKLRTLTGAELDREYIAREVDMHQSALNLIDTKLMPSARKKAVKEQLTALRKLVESHLTRAKQIQSSLPR